MNGIGNNGTYLIALHDVLVRPGTTGPAHNVTFQVRRRDGVWDRECFADAKTYNSPLHDFRIQHDAEDRVWRFDGRIDPDPWVAGGALKVAVRIEGTDGSYEGTFAGKPISGHVSTRFEEKPRPARGRQAPSLRILSEFELCGGSVRALDVVSIVDGRTETRGDAQRHWRGAPADAVPLGRLLSASPQSGT